MTVRRISSGGHSWCRSWYFKRKKFLRFFVKILFDDDFNRFLLLQIHVQFIETSSSFSHLKQFWSFQQEELSAKRKKNYCWNSFWQLSNSCLASHQFVLRQWKMEYLKPILKSYLVYWMSSLLDKGAST